MRFHSINLLKNKQLGVFYTPHHTAESLAAWAIKSGHERILEPSVGAGALLLAALSRSKELTGRKDSLSGLGCDVDHSAISALGASVHKRMKLCVGDFLELSPDTQAKFDVVLANPPFTRNHTIPKERRDELRTRFSVSGAAGLWVHFLFHASGFLVPGGRLVSIVPRSALFTRYAEDLFGRLSGMFQSVKAVEIPERPLWIGNADERGAIIFAEGYVGPAATEDHTRTKENGEYTRPGRPQHDIVKCYDDLIEHSMPLSSIAKLNIGAVTGCNRVFLLDEAERIETGIRREDVYPIISRGIQVRGLRVERRQLETLARAGHKTWLLSPESLHSSVEQRLSLIPKEQRKAVSWLGRRDPWWKVQRGEDCHAVFTYMNDRGPRLVLTGPGIVCTNTLHRVVFAREVTRSQKLAAAVSLVSTFGQLAAELLGRTYGGGVLKFELTETRAFPILRFEGEIEDSFHRINKLLRGGLLEEARSVADYALLRPALGTSWKTGIRDMEVVIEKRRNSRGQQIKSSRP